MGKTHDKPLPPRFKDQWVWGVVVSQADPKFREPGPGLTYFWRLKTPQEDSTLGIPHVRENLTIL